MDSMKGYRTIIFNVLALIFSVAATAGFDIDLEAQGQITTGILALVNIWLRFKTDTPVGKAEPTVKK